MPSVSYYSLRRHTNLACGDQVRQYEAEVLSQVLAFEVQAALDEYKHVNPDFLVRACMYTPKCEGWREFSREGNRNRILGGST
jgi:hypothetical protein